MKYLKIAIIALILLSLFGCETNTTQDGIVSLNSAVSELSFSNTTSSVTTILPFDSYYCNGKPYLEIETELLNAGFTNVISVPQIADNDKETRVTNTVITVLVNGNVLFESGCAYNSDVEIKIYYVVSNVTENSDTDSVSSTNSSYESSRVTENSTSQTVENTTSDFTDNTASSNTATSTQSDTTASNTQNSQTVWVSKSGKKYHVKSSCSGMKTATAITKDEAVSQGYEPCKKCCKN